MKRPCVNTGGKPGGGETASPPRPAMGCWWVILTLTDLHTHTNPPKPPILDPLFSPNCGDSARFWAHFFCQNHPPFSRLSIKPVGASLVPRSTPPRFYLHCADFRNFLVCCAVAHTSIHTEKWGGRGPRNKMPPQ